MSLVFRFGVPASFVDPSPEGGLVVGVACPVAGGGTAEEHWPVGAPVERLGAELPDSDWRWVRTPRFILGAAAVRVTDASLEAETKKLYAGLFQRWGGAHLYRVWHFIPRINVIPPGGIENYRAFCRARAEAFDAAFAEGQEARMPAASAVGVDGDRLVVVVIAGDVAPVHFENPEQMPAYRYPAEYGPKSPSFARATRVRFPDSTWTFVSGTAAIKGCESTYPDDAAAQARVTADNLALMCRLAGVESGAHHVFSRCYVRAVAEAALAPATLPAFATPRLSALRSDICRRELALESEITCVSSSLPTPC